MIYLIKLLGAMIMLFALLVLLLLFSYYYVPPKGTKAKRITKELKKTANVKKYKIDGRTVYTITNKEAPESSLRILYFHGGGYVGGITLHHWNFINKLSKSTKAVIIFPDYPLVPKGNYRDVFRMGEEVYRQVASQGDFIMLGDSAGGAIRISACTKNGKRRFCCAKKDDINFTLA